MSELHAALVAALADLTVVAPERRANAGTYSYSFANIADVVKLTRPVLAEHGLVALTPVHDHGNGLAVTVTLLHEAGGRLDFGPFPFPPGKDAQATGSWVTYMRRYALISALGLAVAEDDDGAAAQPAPVFNAKTHVLGLCGGDKGKAKAAWDGMGAGMDWSAVQLDAAYDEWVHQPGDEQ